MTAPDFRPFEQKFRGKRHLGRATFLRSEEGEELDEGSESEGDAESCFELDKSDLKSRKGTSSKRIYIDQVMERARQ
jgi:hypothetical protein